MGSAALPGFSSRLAGLLAALLLGFWGLAFATAVRAETPAAAPAATPAKLSGPPLRYGGTLLDRLAQVYIEVVRGTPLLIQVLFIYYGLPKIGIQLDPFVAGVLALGLNYAAYEVENYRAGLLAVPRHLMEAAVALNMTERQALKNVIIPQAARMVLPPTTNDFISLIKDSSLVSVISLVELTKTYEQISTTYYDYFGTSILVAAIYLLLGLPFVRLARWAEKHVSRGMTRSGH